MHTSGNQNEKKHSAHHIVPMAVYTRVFATLIVLTVITVASSYVDFGSANILIAMLIATAKALLVVLFFMGLKYDGQENNVTFFASFVFLAIFVGLTSSDLFYRINPPPVKVDPSDLQASAEPVDVKKLVHETPELLAKGKALYAQQCITCHGADGKGDGPAAGTLTPKPRNFTGTEGWKFGRSVANIFGTLTKGSPGTAMPAFSALSAEERFALAHYVHSITPSPPADKPEDIAVLEKELGAKPKPHLSIDQAMELMAREYESSHK